MQSLKSCRNLDELFDLWIEATVRDPMFSEVDESTLRSSFCKDGINNDEAFASQPIKVLFLSNESNESGDENRTENPDRRSAFMDYFNKKTDDWRGKLRRRCCQLYRVITGGDTSVNVSDAAECFAFMNIKKNGGGAVVDIDVMTDYSIRYAEFVKMEIELISPDIIVWCGFSTFCIPEIKEAFGIKMNSVSSIGIFEGCGRPVPVIGTYHTSARITNEKRFASLRESLLQLEKIPEFNE